MDRIECGLIEIKTGPADTDEDMTFTGYGAVFGNVDAYGDVIAKGAFLRTINDAKASNVWPAMLLQHGGWGMSADDLTPIGVWTELVEDAKGLRVEGKLAPTPRGREIYTLLKMKPRPALNGLSIGYVPVKWKMRTEPNEPRRTLEEIKLVEVSPVTFPANTQARITSKGDALSIRTAERALRDAGFSANDAKAILARGFKATPQRDVEGWSDIAAALQRNINALT